MDAEQYAHTLIAKPKDFAPSAAQIERFLSSIVSRNVVPDNPTIVLRIPTGKFREYPYVNPFTGEKIKFEIKDRKKLDRLEDIATALEPLGDYEIEVASVGKPKLPPLLIDFEESYHVGVTCFVYSTPRSTSDLHDNSAAEEKIVPYRKPCMELPREGYFTDPHTMKMIKIPDAGCALFWVEFELGKFLFPKFSNEKLEFLNPAIVSEAKKIFEIDFVQGCYWG